MSGIESSLVFFHFAKPFWWSVKHAVAFRLAWDAIKYWYKIGSDQVRLSLKLKDSGLHPDIIQKLLALRAAQSKSGEDEPRINFDAACQVHTLARVKCTFCRKFKIINCNWLKPYPPMTLWPVYDCNLFIFFDCKNRKMKLDLHLNVRIDDVKIVCIWNVRF